MKNEPQALSENQFTADDEHAANEAVEETPRKKRFVKPTLEREETLAKVTTGFIGSFGT